MIQDELNLSNGYIFETIDNGRLVAISQRNVAIAEAIIRNDSKNLVMSDVNAGPNTGFDNEGSKVYQGSSAFWFTQLGKIMNHEETQYDIQHIIKYSVNAVDRENSTHLNADKVGRTRITERILEKYDDGVLFDLLRNPGDNYFLISEISRPIEMDDGSKGRKNLSFASKFCHYAAFYMFNEEEQDNYSIWDNVLRKAVPLYLHHYHLDNNYDLNHSYPDYQNAIRDIINEAAQDPTQRVSRNGFDHLLWYYHRGRR